jgi:hypothetical protein
LSSEFAAGFFGHPQADRPPGEKVADDCRIRAASVRTADCALADLPRDRWAESTVRFDIGPSADFADEVRFLTTPGATVTVDDVLVYEP